MARTQVSLVYKAGNSSETLCMLPQRNPQYPDRSRKPNAAHSSHWQPADNSPSPHTLERLAKLCRTHILVVFLIPKIATQKCTHRPKLLEHNLCIRCKDGRPMHCCRHEHGG